MGADDQVCLPGGNLFTGFSFFSGSHAGQVKEGRQAYVVCPQVEEGELEELENVVDYAEKLKGALPADIQVAYLHGKMRPAGTFPLFRQRLPLVHAEAVLLVRHYQSQGMIGDL